MAEITLKQGSSFTDTAGRTGTVNYDAKTGQKLAIGGSTSVSLGTGQRATSSGGNYTVSNVVPVDTLGNASNQKVQIPQPPQLNLGQLTGINQGLNGQALSNIETLKQQAIDQSANTQTDFVKQLQEFVGTPPSSADAYRQAQKESGILQAQKQVGDLSTQLNSITAQGQASQLQVVGQGRGIPEAIIGGQQAQIARETAIQALPVAAQLAAAQGNLEMARQNLETLFQIKSQDAQNAYNFKKETAKAFLEIASNAESKKLDSYIQGLDKQQAKQEKNEEQLKQMTITALANGGGAVVGALSKIDTSQPDWFQKAVKIGGTYIAADPLDRQIKQAQLANLREKLSPTNTTVDTSKITSLQDKIVNIDGLLTHSGLNNAVGTTALGRKAPFQIGQKQDFIAGVQQLVSRDTLDTLINLKKAGGTLGALSDQERIMLQSSASKIGTWARTDKKGNVTGYKTSETSFINELNTIKRLSEKALNEAGGVSLDGYLNTIDSVLTVNPYIQAGYIK